MVSTIDDRESPPRVELPRIYNAAVDLLDRHVIEGRGDRIAVIDDRGSHSYAELAARADRSAGALAAMGVVPEQRVAIVMLDSADWIAAFLGAIKLGAVPVPLNTNLTAADYAYMLRDMRARAVIVSEALASKISHDNRATDGVGGDWQARVASAAPITKAAETTPDDVAFWLYSSGSTGKPKGAMHLHGSPILTAALYARPILGIRPDDRVYSAAKLFFAYGLGNALTFPFSVGATSIVCADRPNPATVLRVMREHRPTIFGGVPTLFAQLLADPMLTREAVGPLRVSTSAGEALPKHVGERWCERTGSDILDGIGSTEMLHIFLSNRPGAIAYGTTGTPVPGYELELRGDAGEQVETEGALWVRGPTSCIGYWNDRARSLSTFHGPWTRTGDQYVRNADGTWTYSGRADDMLKVGGIWVSPFEVESALAAHPAVLEAAVVGAEDQDGLIKPKAFVVTRNEVAADELKAFVKDRLAPYKYPRWVEFVSELPKTATGKIQRFKLRDATRA
ncbi:MAG TPA: benzoate-CoA ligase family protein [Kofleriaceae bacterium]|jgi:benzoate-CoA ligase family protein|nr:benzoate-CoA ligase family protein [Kofleriaceae bacterium]